MQRGRSRILGGSADTFRTVPSPTLPSPSLVARALRFAVAACLCASTLVVAGGLPEAVGVEAKPRDALTIAREKLDAAALAAHDAAARLSAVEGERAHVTADIEALEREIPILQARATELRAIVKHRAAQLYTRGGTGPSIEGLIDAAGPLQAARASHLTNVAAEHDVALAAELRATAAKLEAREAELRTKRVELDRVITLVTETRNDLDGKLAIATAAYDKVRIALAAHARIGGGPLVSLAMRCPVGGFTAFTDDFGAPRHEGRLHEGIDMEAVLETPVVAVVDGNLVHDVSPAGGFGALLTDEGGDTYYYAHFSRYEGRPRRVLAGDVIGFVGMTGITTGPHLHFEMHPDGGSAVDPYALLLGLCLEEMALPKPKSA